MNEFNAGHETGFSLVELLVAMTISLLVLGTTLTLTTQVQRNSQFEMDVASVRHEAQYAVDWITRELRSAGANPYLVTTSSCPVAGTTFRAVTMNPDGDGLADDIRIHADVNAPNGRLGGSQGACTEANEDVTISHDAGGRVITRRDNNLDAAAVPMTDTVITALTFTYLDATRTATTSDALVAFIQVAVDAETRVRDPRTGQPATVTATDELRVRVR